MLRKYAGSKVTAILALNAEGCCNYVIAARLGCTRQNVRQTLKRHNRPRVAKRRIPKAADKV